MTQRATPPFRADHVGSLLRPAALKEARAKREKNEITADRSPAVREQARAAGIQLLHKPVKPAALRALLAQWRVLRVVAAE